MSPQTPYIGKPTGRTMTLRGDITYHVGRQTQYGMQTEQQIFEYDSTDRKRAWRITYATAWIQEALTGTAGGDSRMLAQYTLSTDKILDNVDGQGFTDAASAQAWERRIGPNDNRTIAWGAMDYQNRDNTNADFVVSPQGIGTPLVLDIDRIITSELWFQGYAITEGSSFSTKVAYYIEMEEVTIKPELSILQQIKGMGQDV